MAPPEKDSRERYETQRLGHDMLHTVVPVASRMTMFPSQPGASRIVSPVMGVVERKRRVTVAWLPTW